MHTKESIRALLDSNERAVYRAMLALQARQTADEQAGHMTRHTNGVGFNKLDAPWMADMVRKYHRYGSLLPKPLAITRNKLKRYAGQLADIANGNEERDRIRAQSAAPVATMPSVTPDGVADYQRYATACRCEDFDGERKCDHCLKAEFAAREAEQERAAFMSDPDLAHFRRARAAGAW